MNHYGIKDAILHYFVGVCKLTWWTSIKPSWGQGAGVVVRLGRKNYTLLICHCYNPIFDKKRNDTHSNGIREFMVTGKKRPYI